MGKQQRKNQQKRQRNLVEQQENEMIARANLIAEEIGLEEVQLLDQFLCRPCVVALSQVIVKRRDRGLILEALHGHDKFYNCDRLLVGATATLNGTTFYVDEGGHVLVEEEIDNQQRWIYY